MEGSSMGIKDSRTRRIKAAEALRKVPTALMLKKKAECDRIALKIVERMTEPRVDSVWLIKSLHSINRSHMEDVAEERSIVKLCGYVLCDNPLTKVVKKQYQISTLRNKVYDVSKVKNYCSFGCYKAAKFLTEQIETSPLWLRDREQAPHFQLMEKECDVGRSSPPGVEINLTGGIDIPQDCGEPSEKNLFDSEGKKLKKFSAVSDLELSEDRKKENNLEIESDSEIYAAEEERGKDERDPPSPDFDTTTSNAEQPETLSLNISRHLPDESGLRQENRKTVRKCWKNSSGSNNNPAQKSIEQARIRKTSRTKNRVCYESLASRVEKNFGEWITKKTVCLLHGRVEEKEMILEGVRREEKYEILCKKLNRLRIEEERGTMENLGKLEPAPNFLALREEARGLELKVRAFWQGKTIIDRETIKPREEVQEEVNTVLPMIDLRTPNALRRRIFTDKLNKVIHELLPTLVGGESSDSYTPEICACVKTLVSTFALNATNITFKTAEWTLVALFVIKLLGLMNQRIKYLLGNKRAKMYISMILMSYKLEPDYLDNAIGSWTSPEDTTRREMV